MCISLCIFKDYKENMESHRDNHRYAAWNLESTAELVQKKYPKSLVSVIKPSEMHLRTFSVYSNFVEFDALGVHYLGPEKGSWSHLKALHRNILAEVEKNRDEVSGQCQSDSTKEEKCVQDSLNSEHFSSLPIHIVGFSKGCVVLNQLLYDLSSTHKEPEAADFIRNVKTLTWLDGGHAGGFNTWVTDENILEELKKTGIKIFVHVTPYQVRDPMRQWIGKEEKKFVEKSRKLGIDIKEVLHFGDEKGSLENHFEVIRVFTNAL